MRWCDKVVLLMCSLAGAGRAATVTMMTPICGSRRSCARWFCRLALSGAEYWNSSQGRNAHVGNADAFGSLNWTFPDRPLTQEFARILGTGYLRGADLWHVACALYLSPNPQDLTFLTLDARQKRVAAKLGFHV